MLIRSQDRKSLVNLDNVESIDICGYRVDGFGHTYQDDENANTWYVAYSGYEKMLFIGRYSTETKAVKVIDMIQQAYKNSLYCDHAYDYAAKTTRPYIFANNQVYQMPTDEEVERSCKIMNNQVSKPREHYNWCDLSEDEKLETARWYCTICDRGLDESYNYCPDCGQKIDWGNEDE